MSGRLPSGVLASALLRRVNDAGGFGMVLAKGDAQSGTILVVAFERGVPPKLLERGLGPDGTTILIDSTPPPCARPRSVGDRGGHRRSATVRR
jgi:hypothetical protein